MYSTISQTGFLDAFHNMGRADEFTYDALRALYDYYETMEDDTGEQIELDVIAICCDWSEEGEADIRQNYGIGETVDVLDYLLSNTIVMQLDNGNFLYITF